MSHDTDTYVPGADPRREHHGVSSKDFVERLDIIEAQMRARADRRHAENEKMHQIIGQMSERIDKHDDELATLKENGGQQLNVLNQIKDALIGNMGSPGIVKRLELLETRNSDLEKKVFIATGVIVILGFVATIINWKDVIK